MELPRSIFNPTSTRKVTTRMDKAILCHPARTEVNNSPANRLCHHSRLPGKSPRSSSNKNRDNSSNSSTRNNPNTDHKWLLLTDMGHRHIKVTQVPPTIKVLLVPVAPYLHSSHRVNNSRSSNNNNNNSSNNKRLPLTHTTDNLAEGRHHLNTHLIAARPSEGACRVPRTHRICPRFNGRANPKVLHLADRVRQRGLILMAHASGYG